MMYALYGAIKACDETEAIRLIDAQADVNATHNSESLLTLACSLGLNNVASRLLTSNVNVQSSEPLAFACEHGMSEVVRQLIHSNVDVNARRNSDGEWPLSLACKASHVDIIQQLIAANADLELRGPGGFTVLLMCRSSRKMDIESILIAAGANVNVLDECGCSHL